MGTDEADEEARMAVDITDSAEHNLVNVEMALEESAGEYDELAMIVDAGIGIEDSGCTYPVMGDSTWQEWLRILTDKKLEHQVQIHKCHRVFKFGNDSVVHSTSTVEFPVSFCQIPKRLRVCLVPGSMPLLLSRGTFADWGFVQDYRNSKGYLLDHPGKGWFDVEKSTVKEHFVFQLLKDLQPEDVAMIVNSNQVPHYFCHV